MSYQDIKSKEAREYMEDFEIIYWGHKGPGPLYVKRSQWERIKDAVPPGNYVVVED